VASCRDAQQDGARKPAVPEVHAAATTAPVPAQSTGAATTRPAELSAHDRALGFTFGPAPAIGARSAEQKDWLNRGCVACHQHNGQLDHDTMHVTSIVLACVDCHGGSAVDRSVSAAQVEALRPDAYERLKNEYHVRPSRETAALWKGPDGKLGSANPSAPGVQTLREDINFIRFVNPGDLLVAQMSCGACHNSPGERFIVDRVRTSMMSHGAMLWGAALYNNGAINRKDSIYGEAYTMAEVDGNLRAVAAAIKPATQPSPPTEWERRMFGWRAQLFPLPRWEVSQPGNILRVFEMGGKGRPIVGIPNVEEDPGHPDVKLSDRGFGTEVRTDPVFIGLQKTRLLDPTLALFGTNDHPGDYRASGCSACHVVYANDRSPVHSAKWSNYGNRGESFSSDRRVNASATSQPYDATVNQDPGRKAREAGHPIAHTFVARMPTQTCVVCHVHPGTNVVNSYLGFTWWDNETDGEAMYPKKQVKITAARESEVYAHNPEGASVRGLWSDPDFLANLTSLNPTLKHTQFADFHGHGWVFRAVFKQDRHGNLLNEGGEVIERADATALAAGVSAATQPAAAEKAAKLAELKKWNAKLAQTQFKPLPTTAPVHLKDVHLEKGMQCVDCHFEQDNHGDGHLYAETRAAVMVDCVDCHGTASERPRIVQALEARRDNQDVQSDKKASRADKAKAKAAYEAALARAFSGAAAPSSSTTQPLDAVQQAALTKALEKHFALISPEDDTQPSVLFQKSAMDESGKTGWPIRVVTDSVAATPPALWAPTDDEGKKRTAMARFAHSVRVREAGAAADAPVKYGLAKGEKEADVLAHANTKMACYACHSSWNTSCFGCHLAMRANQYKPMLHNEGQTTRNYTNYSYQTLRDDVYMLGVDSTVKDHRVVPVRSACAVMVSSQDANRQWIYGQQQTVSAEGYAGTAFSPYFPHTVRTRETKTCNDCHVSKENDNNAVMAQLLMQGTNAVNFVGRYAWVGEGRGGLEAVAVAERDEPQAVYGSKLHRLAYPDDYRDWPRAGRGVLKLKEAHDHEGTVYDLQLRGEYLYAACGEEGFIAYDVANIDNKGFSERIVTAPVSPLGQRLYVRTKDARGVASPSTLALDPTRSHLKSGNDTNVNEEGVITVLGSKDGKTAEAAIHPLFAFLYVADAREGLVVIGNTPKSREAEKYGVGVSTLLDGNPENNFLSRAKLADRSGAYNPGGVLTGARSITLCGHYAYLCADAGLVVVDLDNPLAPRHVATVAAPLNHPNHVAFQFRYAFVADADGLKVLDVTNPADPRPVQRDKRSDGQSSAPDFAMLRMPGGALDIYVCRTFGYVAAGKNGLYIVDLEKPDALRADEPLDATDFTQVGGDGKPLFSFRQGDAVRRTRHAIRVGLDANLRDCRAVRVGMTNNSLFAYVADGSYGLKVLQLTSDETPGFNGFSPIPVPKLIAQHATRGPAVALSKGLDRDRAVDESGHQLSVFGRRGARPFTLEEQRRMYLVKPSDATSAVWRVSEDPAQAQPVDARKAGK
jgi:hypothetical protein